MTLLSLSAGWLGVLIFGMGSVTRLPDHALPVDISPQPMEDALNSFAQKSGLQILFPAPLVAGKSAPRVKGIMTPGAALDALLADSGLSFVTVDPNTIRLESKPLVANAPPAKPPRQPEPTDVVTVIGSNIRANLGYLHLKTIDADQLARSGKATVRDMLTGSPHGCLGATAPDGASLFNPAAKGVNENFGWACNLRGLGPGATLILVNGRKIAPSSGFGARYADVSMIPLSAVARIDILLDGRSAIHGSDAIAGVVNIVMRTEYDRAQTGLRVESFTQAGERALQAAQTAGGQWNSGEVIVAYQYDDVSPFDAASRAGTRDIATFGYTDVDYLPQQRQHSLYIGGRQELSPRASLSTSGGYSLRLTDAGYRSNALGGIRTRSRSETEQTIAMAELRLHSDEPSAGPDSWQTTLAVGTSSNRVVGALLQEFSALSSSNANQSRSKTTLASASIRADGTAFQLRNGPVRVALGAEVRKQEYNSLDAATDHLAHRCQDAFGEVNFPILAPDKIAGIALVGAARYEDCDDFARSVNPQVGVQIAPSSTARLYANWGRSFKAPALPDVAPSRVAVGLQDVGTQRFVTKYGSNPDLRPETAETFAAGIDFGSKDLALGFNINFFRVHYRGQIDSVQAPLDVMLSSSDYGALRILRGQMPDHELNTRLSALLRSPSLGYAIAGCSTLDYQGGPCLESLDDIDGIFDFGLRNLASTRMKGVDLSISKSMRTSFGRLQLRAEATRLLELETRVMPSSQPQQLLNTPYHPLEFTAVGDVGLFWKRFESRLSVHYAAAYKNPFVTPAAKVGSMTTIDLLASYSGLNGMGYSPLHDVRATLIITNLLDRKPPYVLNPSMGVLTHDSMNASVLGRSVALSLTKQW